MTICDRPKLVEQSIRNQLVELVYSNCEQPTSSSEKSTISRSQRPSYDHKAEIVAGPPVEEGSAEDYSFSQDEIQRTTRLARDHGFDGFDSGRAANATYEDTRFFELQTFMGMVGYGTPKGANHFQYRHRSEDSPDGDTHLRAVKQFGPETLIEGFDAATDRVLSAIGSEASFRRPVPAAIDITIIPYYGDVERMSMVSGTKDEEQRAFKFATLSIIGQNIPLILGVEPIREGSSWDRNLPNKIHRIVRRLVKRAQGHVPIETVLCDREFDLQRVFQSLPNLGVSLLLCDEFTQLGLIHASLADTRLVTTPTLLSVLVQTGQLSATNARILLDDISEARSWDTNSYVQRARSLLAES